MSIKDVNDKLNIDFSNLNEYTIKKSKIKALVLEDFYIKNNDECIFNSLLAIKFNKFQFDISGDFAVNYSLFECFDTKGPLYINIDFINKVFNSEYFYNAYNETDCLGYFPFDYNKNEIFNTRYVTINYKDFILEYADCITSVKVFTNNEKLKCQSESNYFVTTILSDYYGYAQININEIPFINLK